MAKKQSFLDKTQRGKQSHRDYVKVVRAYKAENGAWKFRTKVLELNDENKAEIYK